MKFAHVEMLFLFWLIPLMLLAYLYGWRRRNRILNGFVERRALKLLVPTGMPTRRRLQAGLILMGALFLVVAMAGPQYGFQWQTVERRGVDLIVALDCSRSMLAQDIQPTRLDRAKREIIDLLNMLRGDRVGLVAFSGTAFLQCPLTVDYTAFDLFLNVLTPDYLPVGGSDMSAAVQTALGAFETQSPAEKAIILITDGENTGRDDPEKAAREAQKAGVKLFCIGVGSTEGVPVPSGKGGFQKGADGQIILTRLDEPLLTRMAVTTGGTYVRSVAGDMDLDRIYQDQIRGAMSDATIESGRKQVWADRYQWPLSLALALLLAALAIPGVQKDAAAVFICSILLALAPRPVAAGPLQQGYEAYQQGAYEAALNHFLDGQVETPDAPEVLYNIGNAYYKTGKYDDAYTYYSRALAKAPPPLKEKLLYNLGNAAFRRQALDEAVKNYEAALAIDPKDEQAQANLAFVREQLEQQQQSQPNGDSNQDQQKKPPDQESQPGQQPPENQPDHSEPQAQNGRQSPEEDQKQPKPQTGSETNSDTAASDQQQDRQAGKAPSEASKKGEQPSSQAAQQMLNRLKDEPGRAMMPNYRKQTVNKDW